MPVESPRAVREHFPVRDSEVVVVPGVVTVPSAPGRRHVDSLSELDLAVLGAAAPA